MANSDRTRPNPDRLLSKIHAEEESRKRGRLKIFLGYAAGVGKTYAMLEAARIRRSEGLDVAVGYVETHHRAETDALLAGLEIIPRKTVPYRGINLTEMDFDAVLARRPKIAVVDELAHTNVPGSVHPKRYQDVQDLLSAGIDVYTTLNIQHIDSLNDIVAQITGVKVHETLPDTVLEEADDIEVVDLPPEELIRRLQAGKVYISDQAARAVQEFFRRGNLTALREMSLRFAAERVEGQMQTYMEAKAIEGPWPAGERLMVCIHPGAMGERLVRSARRLAGELNCEWLAVYVEQPEHAGLSDADHDRIARTLQRAEDLGGKSITLTGSPLHAVLLDYARKNNVTRIIIGKSSRPRWVGFLQGTLAERLVRESGSIDIFVTSGEAGAAPGNPVRGWVPHRPLRRYLGSLILVAAATVPGYAIRGYLSPANLVMIYLLAVVIAAVNLGSGPSMLTAFLSVLAFDFFLVPPYLTFAVSDTEYLLTFAGLLTVGVVISRLAARLRSQAESAERHRAETTSLYGLSRDLSAASDLDDILKSIAGNIEHTFDRSVVIFLPDAAGKLQPVKATADFPIGENELAVAEWAFEHNQPAGRGTDTLTAAEARYLPLGAGGNRVGILAVRPRDPNRHLPPEGYRLLEAFASQASLAIERVRLTEHAQQMRLLEATEKLQSALLNSLTHNLRTPLVSITGALTSLDEQSPRLSDDDRRSLIQTARGEADRLNQLVGNLFSMARIESGALHLHLDTVDLADMISKSLELLGRQIEDHPVRVSIPPDFPSLTADFGLMVQGLVNLLDNAVKYSPAGSPIDISADTDGATVHLEIADRGIGIPEDETDRVFDKFYRIRRPESVGGSGLGLSISRGIVEAHGGRVYAMRRPGGGTIVAMEIPLRE